ncbi:hypothetical protein Tdes44962_MAKER06461 [Teratosphaeria destructans]|uniref:Uncharacterized protein n=1 Tax=Teratosphaeria destructans TaxID=418781 RepID=A0A9W7T1L2_9PEZI|nr:hypothetical protein Tdes44962_MAKER06461 [Teratosphaeria destructans]
MGGNAFQHAYAPGEPTLCTPRMSPETYGRLSTIYQKRLMDAFSGSQVTTLVEAPEKETYGDMDFVVARNAPVDWDWQDVADDIGARGFIRLSRYKCTLAVPADGSKYVSKAVQYMPMQDVHTNAAVGKPYPPAALIPQKRQASSIPTEEGSDPDKADSLLSEAAEYAHIDIEVVSQELYGWYMFYASYGDMAGLIGHTVRQLGFTITDKGFYVRHKSLDDSKHLTYVNIPDKEGMLHLSHDPDRVMQFLGLSVERYSASFKTIEELFTWLGECRLLSREAMIWKRDRSTDRQKDKRAIFSNFLNFWLPEHHPDWVKVSAPDIAQQPSKIPLGTACEAAPSSTSHGLHQAEVGASVAPLATVEPSALVGISTKKHILPKPIDLPDTVLEARDNLASEAADFFDKRSEFEAMSSNLMRKVGNATAGELLKAMLRPVTGKSEKGLNEIVRAFRRQVAVDDDHNMTLLEVPHADEESELYKLISDNGKIFMMFKAVKAFAEERWEEIRERERNRAKAAKEKKDGGQV